MFSWGKGWETSKSAEFAMHCKVYVPPKQEEVHPAFSLVEAAALLELDFSYPVRSISRKALWTCAAESMDLWCATLLLILILSMYLFFFRARCAGAFGLITSGTASYKSIQVAAWRFGIDPKGRGQLNFNEFCTAVRRTLLANFASSCIELEMLRPSFAEHNILSHFVTKHIFLRPWIQRQSEEAVGTALGRAPQQQCESTTFWHILTSRFSKYYII